jgi:two-component system NtrC family sensor kinase
VRHLSKSHNFNIRLTLHAVQPVKINPNELQQVLVNLVVNAVHALDESGGQIEIESEEWPQQGVVVHVRDNGIGMDDETLGKIFNPFFSHLRKGYGSGLGLSISYSLIQKYGGKITVESQPGKGSRFSVWLLREPVTPGDDSEHRDIDDRNVFRIQSG